MDFHASPSGFNTDPAMDLKILSFSICGLGFGIEQESEDDCDDSKRDDTNCYE